MIKYRNMFLKISRYTLIVLTTVFITSCVSQKKYNDLLNNKARSDREVSRLTQVEKDHEALKGQMAETTAALDKATAELSVIKAGYDSLKDVHGELKAQYDVLLTNNRQLLASASDEKKELMTQLAVQQGELDDKRQQLGLLEEQLNTKEKDIADRETRIAALTDQLNAQKQSLQALKEGLNQALRGFSASDLTVVERNGKIYVSMSQKLLFASGSKIIDQKGKEALAKLAEVLAASSDIDILVEGHTDTDGTADFNWDLSVARATAVVKELTAHGVDPKHLTAAGRAFYVPVASNDTEEGKAKNRRTEIILSPKLDQLYQMLGDNQ